MSTGTKAETILRKCPGPCPCPLLTIVYYPHLFFTLSSVDYYFICIFDPYLVHVPGFLKMLEFTVIHRCRHKPWKGTWEAFSNRRSCKYRRRCGYRWELSATLGREEGTEIEHRHYWPMIRSQCLFNETSIRFHKYAFQGAFGVVTHGVMWGSYVSGRGGSPHLHFHFALHISLILLSLDLSFMITWYPYIPIWVFLLSMVIRFTELLNMKRANGTSHF